MKLVRVLWIAVLLVGLAFPGVAQEVNSGDRSEPINISADRLEADDVAQKLVFVGNAVAKQGDITISSERLVVQYSADNRDVAEIIAEGSVRITQGERVASGQRAVYDKNEERIVLTGSPVVKEGPNSVQGHEIILFLDGKRSIVKGGQDGRVKAVFQPGSGDKP
ncbi:MAG: lipopolysaccharide transport periplasmic protein LptA [Desulfuromonadales bacterium]|nr:lipopolysaccharide transport periplasmic protein LptA [Desulfuromonadales bacterium]